MADRDPGASEARFAALARNIESFAPNLLSGFRDLVRELGGAGALEPRELDIASNLVRGTDRIYLDRAVVAEARRRGELLAFARVMLALHEANPNWAAAFARVYPVIGHELAAVEASLLAFARGPGPKADAGARLAAWSFALPDPADRTRALEGFAELASRCPGILGKAADVLDRHFAGSRADRLRSWLDRGFGLARVGRAEEASDHFCLRSRESRAAVGLRGALLSEEREILRIFAASLSDRGLDALPLELSAFGSTRAYTDGRSVFLPPGIGAFADEALNRRAYAAMTALLVGLVEGGTYSFDLGACEFRYELGRRFGGLLPPIKANLVRDYGKRIRSMRERRGNVMELLFHGGRRLVVLETDIEKFYYSFPTPWFARKLFTSLELYRVERGLSRRYEGLAEDFARMNGLMAALVPGGPRASRDVVAGDAVARDAVAGDRQASLSRSFRAVIELFHLLRLGSARAPRPGETDQEARLCGGLEALFVRVGAEDATVATTAECAFEAYCLCFDAFPLSAYLDASDAAVAWDSPLDPALEPAIAADRSPELFPERPDRPRPETDDDGAKSLDLTARVEVDEKVEDLRSNLASGAVSLFAYPEFDDGRKRYERRRCVLAERTLAAGDPAWFDAVVAAHRRVQMRMTKKFLAMMPEDVELTRRWPDGDEVHLGDAVDFATDLLRGAAGDDRVYLRKTVNKRSVALQLLVDASSSTRDEVNGVPVIDIEKAALALLGSALHRTGDEFSLAAYNSGGPRDVRFYLAKDFDEPWSATVRSRIESIRPWSANRDGCAIRHATARLSARNRRTRILLLLSDGIPADPEYGSADGSATNSYALEDTRRAILEARRAGIVPFCITVDVAAKDYVGHLYGDHSFSVLSDVGTLPERLARLYLRLTR